MTELDLKSFLEHDSQYQKCDYNFCLKQQEEWKNKKIEYDFDKPIGKILDNNKTIEIGIDIGCGHGYFSNLMANTLKEVYAIEPSKAAVEMAKILQPNKNIIWSVGLGERILPTLNLDKPAIFHTGVVLSHLEDNTVIKICDGINKIALKDSILCFSELWGVEYHAPLWHCRTKNWWQNNFKDWKFNFIPINIQVPGRFKSFTAIKIQ